ncbi:multiprotein-bridging factor 1 family protein [uncultured Jatrophihabitans sp.]|uniref:helix-turn-helix domain-containing protein n=1 Tax=uncultured Jatrophihabitans sp. TaxID=1610747 RepID=UPI0035CBF0CA
MTDVLGDVKQARRPAPTLSFGDYVRIARRELRMSQGELAAALSIKTPTLSAWESGRNVPDDLPRVASDLERVTGFARQWFLGWGDVVPPATSDTEVPSIGTASSG